MKITGSGRTFSWECDGLCLCTGCTSRGSLVYEGYSIPVTGGHCGCSRWPRQVETEPEDIAYTVTFAENDTTNGPSTVTAKLTSVKVELEAVDEAKDNPCMNRHMYGVHEWVKYRHYPADVNVELTIVGAEQDLVSSSDRFFCPWAGGTYWLHFQALGETYETDIDVYEPEVVCREVWWNQIGVSGQSGLLDMRLALYIEPTFVSFKDLNMEEIPDDETCPHSGYFSTGDVAKTGALSHSRAARAGIWSAVRLDTSWVVDKASRETPYPQPWSDGMKEWRIPVGWGDYNGNVKGQVVPNPTTQLFTIDFSGMATIRKYNHEIRRATNNDVWLDAEIPKGWGLGRRRRHRPHPFGISGVWAETFNRLPNYAIISLHMIRVVIIDDHVVVRAGLRYIIEADAELEFAGEYGGGVGAAEFVAGKDPDVVLLDVRMPDRGGIDVLRDLLAAEPGRRVVMLTTSDVEEDVFRAIEEGALGYVMKESPIETISAAIRSAMAGEVFMTDEVRRIYETRRDSKGLSAREAEALELAAKGANNREIAKGMGLSENSVKMFLKRAFFKLGAANRAEAVQLAAKRGLIREL